MNKLLDDIRKDAIKKSTRSSHRHTHASLCENALAIIKSVCLLSISYKKGGPARLSKEMTQLSIPNQGLLHMARMIGDRIGEGFSLEHITEYASGLYWTNEQDGFTALLYYLVVRGMVLVREEVDAPDIAFILSSCIPSDFVSESDIKKLIKDNNLQAS